MNGDALAEKFPATKIPGQLLVIREAFIEGPVSTEFSNEYWERRAAFISSTYGAEKEDYSVQFLNQLHQLEAISPDDEINLWFEDDLFCQTNMWFSVYYISTRIRTKFYRIFPKKDNINWSGFGRAEENELMTSFEGRQEFSEDDVALTNRLWEAYVANDRDALQILSASETTCFRFLPEVIQAHLERTSGEVNIGRPQQTLMNILNDGKTNFYEICDDFWKKESIYGFGDVQVYNMLKEMEIEFSGDIPMS